MAGVPIIPFKRVSTGDTNAAVIKASAGRIHVIVASNVNAAVRYLKLYDLAVAPTVGTSVPTWTIPLQGGATGTHTDIAIPAGGLDFGTGIAMALTTEATDAGNTGVSASETVVNIGYS
jgi:hypothetical protein